MGCLILTGAQNILALVYNQSLFAYMHVNSICDLNYFQYFHRSKRQNRKYVHINIFVLTET